MKLPASVRVGFKDYTVSRYPKDAQRENGHWGRTSTGAARIWIHETEDAREDANTLLHEVLHACFHVGSLEYSGDEEEQLVSTLANQLSGVFRDNPGLIKWLAKNLE